MARLPLLGAVLAGYSPARFAEPLELPGLVSHAPGDWRLFAAGLLAGCAALAPVLVMALRARPAAPPPAGRFPRWGWLGVALCAASWVLAWAPIPGLEWLRARSFTPLWCGYVVVVNAWVLARSGDCLLRRPRALAGLAALSAVFWWFFEYLNRFVESWRYEGVGVEGWGDLLAFGVLPFATVLPAVVSTQQLLATFPRFASAFSGRAPWRPPAPRVLGALLVVASAAGLMALPLWPNVLFPLPWLAPLLLITGLQASLGWPHVFTSAGRGDFQPLVTWALAGLGCGFFWEMWNVASLARWTYVIPWVDQVRVFEMPLLGYFGYLAFGWECAAVSALVRGEEGISIRP